MLTCELCRTQTLDHLFGLLDEADDRAFQTHIVGCAACAAALRQEREFQTTLGRAARVGFPDVQFAPPTAAEVAARDGEGKSLPVPSIVVRGGEVEDKRPTMNRIWTRWAIAASFLIVVVGLGAPAAREFFAWKDQAAEYNRAKAAADAAEKNLQASIAANEARRLEVASELSVARTEHNELQAKWQTAWADAKKAIESKRLFVRVTGPERPQPGAPNEWKVETLDRNHVYQPAKVDLLVKDQTGREVYRETKDRSPSPPSIKLPVDAWKDLNSESQLFLEVVCHHEGAESKLCEKVELAKPVYATTLSTDKPMYQPGQTVYYRSLTLDRTTFLPPDSDLQLQFDLIRPDNSRVTLETGVAKIVAEDGKPVNGPDGKPLRGVAAGSFVLTPESPGGEYTLVVSEIAYPFDERTRQMQRKATELEKRRFLVNKYVAETVMKKLEFDGKSYGAGDLVQVKAEAERAQGKLNNVEVRATVNIDGQDVQPQFTPRTDANGVVNLRFRVPVNMSKGEGSVTVTFADKDGPEAITRPIPLIGKKLDVAFYPEGGELITGIEGRVYFQARTPKGKPADLKGQITDGEKVVAEVATLTDADQAGVSRGQGRFAFTPEKGKRYYLQLKSPVGIDEEQHNFAPGSAIGGLVFTKVVASGFPLPLPKDDGVVLTVPDGVTAPGEPIRIKLQSATARKLLVGAYARGRLLGHERIGVEANKAAEVKLNPDSGVGGVTRITVFEEQQVGERTALLPRAERLVYRKPEKTLLVHAQPDKTRYTPGSQVELSLSARDEKEKNVAAVLMIGVVNQSIITMADMKTDRLMPSNFLLASEVEKPEDLEFADFLLGDHAKAAPALDLLLGTQGWRRFVEQDPKTFQNQPARPADRLLLAYGQKSQTPIDTLRREAERVDKEFEPKYEAALDRLVAAEEAQREFNTGADFAARQQSLSAERNAARQKMTAAAEALARYDADSGSSRSWIMPALCLGLMGVATGSLFVAMARKTRRESPRGYYATAGVTFAMCVMTIVGMVAMNRSGGSHGFDMGRSQAKATAEFFRADERMARNEAMTAPAMDAMMPMEGAPAGGRGGAGPRAPGAAMPAGPDQGMELRRPNVPPRAMEPKKEMPRLTEAKAKGAAPVAKADPTRKPTGENPVGNNRAVDDMKLLEQLKALDADKAQKEARRDRDEAEGARLQLAEALDRAKFKENAGKGDAKARIVNELAMRRRFAEEAAQRKHFDGVTRQQRELGGIAPGGRPEPGFAVPADGRMAERERLAPPIAPPFIVREYAHRRPAGQAGELRDDFTETVCWHPVIVVPEAGRKIDFALSSDITKFQVILAGHTLDGRIGASMMQIDSRKPFSVDPKLPVEITASDRIDVPVRVINDSSEQRVVTFDLVPTALKLEGIPFTDTTSSSIRTTPLRDRIELAADGKGRKLFSFRAGIQEGTAALEVVGTSEPAAPKDTIKRTVNVVPDGFPVVGAYSDLLEKRSVKTIELPKDMVKGSLKVSLNVYPSTLSDLQKGLEGLLREPNGCFEQTSTSNYPNTLILDYLETSEQANPEAARRAKELLDRGYQKLTSFECQKQQGGREGYEWFGGHAPPHEALTAYGLLQFKDMAKVRPVDAEMLKRTQQYLLSQKDDATGSFKRNARAIDTFGRAPQHITDAYIVWALTESDPGNKTDMDLSKQLTALEKTAETPVASKDPYFLSLLANSLLNWPDAGNRQHAVRLLQRVAELQSKAGAVEGATTSITRSGGRDLQIETTALAVLGWLKANDPEKFTASLNSATKWISQQRGGYGGFGSTQSTILALKALIAHTKANKHPAEEGEVTLTVNGKKFTKKFGKEDQEVVTLNIEKPEEAFKAGENELVAEITTKSPYPFSVAWTCQTLTPLSGKDCAVQLTTKLDRANAVEGETVKLGVSLVNKLDTDHGMATAIVGLPAGTKLPPDMKQLTKLREDGVISYFETRGRELIVYWRALAPKQTIDLNIDLICDVPGEYRGPASRGYLYYNADHKHWVEPLAIKIAAAQE